MNILEYDDFLNEMALSPEEKKARRKARREAKKGNRVKPMGNKDIEDLDDEIDSNSFKPSKSMTGAVERVRIETIKFQDLQKEFVLTPKDNIAKREILKKRLVAQSKVVKRAEAEFEKLVSVEEDDFAQDLFFESFNITEYLINENLSPSNIRRMEGLVKTKSQKDFIKAANDMIQDLYDDGYEFYEAHQYLIHLIENEANWEE
jgi:hypothetical protein